MPYGSAIASVMAKYGTLTASNFPSSTRPPIWLDEAPQEKAAAAQQRLPYVIIRDGGGTDQWDEETNSITPGTFSLEVYYSSTDALGDCDTAMKAILWNGSNPNLIQGIGFMTLDLTAPYYGMGYGVKPTTSRRQYAGLDYQGARVYMVTQEFDVISGMRGTG